MHATFSLASQFAGTRGRLPFITGKAKHPPESPAEVARSVQRLNLWLEGSPAAASGQMVGQRSHPGYGGHSVPPRRGVDYIPRPTGTSTSGPLLEGELTKLETSKASMAAEG